MHSTDTGVPLWSGRSGLSPARDIRDRTGVPSGAPGSLRETLHRPWRSVDVQARLLANREVGLAGHVRTWHERSDLTRELAAANLRA
jgi:hypothetical protein